MLNVLEKLNALPENSFRRRDINVDEMIVAVWSNVIAIDNSTWVKAHQDASGFDGTSGFELEDILRRTLLFGVLSHYMIGVRKNIYAATGALATLNFKLSTYCL